MIVFNELTDGPGYCFEELSPSELDFVRRSIVSQYLGRLDLLQPDLVPAARERGIDRYHTLPIAFDHGQSWPKSSRLLPSKLVADFSRMGFFRRIQKQLGPSAIISHDELNWRLVRPNEPNDVDSLHAGKWFRDAGHGSMPEGYDRFKVWIAIYTEPGSNGLSLKPYSHRKTWKHHFEENDGAREPVLDVDPGEIEMELLRLAAGQMVIFHDEMLHGGVVNRGATCRVSIELTVLFDRAEGFRRARALNGAVALS